MHLRSPWWYGIILMGSLMLWSVRDSAASPRSFVVDLLMGEPIPIDSMLDDLQQVRVVYVGEIHTIARHHVFQAYLLDALAKRNPMLALGLEMFTQDQQPILDRWQRGSEDLAALVRDLGVDRWTNLTAYADVLLTARKRGIPIIGLNTSTALVRRFAMKGIEGLTPAERQTIPADLKEHINPLNDRLLRLRLRVHKAFQGMSLDRIVLAQALRDETMAQAIVRFLQSPEGQKRTMMVIAGNGHVNFGFGIPDAVKRSIGVDSRIIVCSESGELVLSEEEKSRSVPITITHEDLRFIRTPIADYLSVAPLPAEESI